MLKGSTLLELKQDSLALVCLMVLVMVVAVTRFRRTLD
jgi:ABC-2 type transport system permease protein